MALITRKRAGRKAAETLARYEPGDTPYPYRDCLKEVKRTGVVAAQEHRSVDREERAGAQVDILRMALETIAANWLDTDGGGPTVSMLAGQRESDQKLARAALKHARALDADRTKAREQGELQHRVGKR